MDYEQNFWQLVKVWIDPEKKESPKSFTVHRQNQLKAILASYGGTSIPIDHFTDRITKDGVLYFRKKKCGLCGEKEEGYEEVHLRNYEAFPVVYAYLCGIMTKEGSCLQLKEDIELGQESISRKGTPAEAKIMAKEAT